MRGLKWPIISARIVLQSSHMLSDRGGSATHGVLAAADVRAEPGRLRLLVLGQLEREVAEQVREDRPHFHLNHA